MPLAPDDYQGILPDGWTGGQHVSKWWRGSIVHLYTLRRPCAECGGEMRIDVSKAALFGTAKNAGLHLKRCKTCRVRSKAIGSSSRPKVEGEAVRKAAVTVEVPGVVPEPAVDDALRTANATMRAELEGLYAEVAELRKRLAKYELESAMEVVAHSPANGAKMPWESV